MILVLDPDDQAEATKLLSDLDLAHAVIGTLEPDTEQPVAYQGKLKL